MRMLRTARALLLRRSASGARTPMAAAHATAAALFPQTAGAAAASFATSSSPRVLLQDAVRQGRKQSRDAPPLEALGLERGQSNSYYNKQLRAALAREDVARAMQILAAVRARSGDAAKEAVIWTPTYELLLFELTKRGDMKQTLVVLEEMVALERVSRRGFHTALVACSKRRRLSAAAAVLELMRECRMAPGPFAYANAINCCSKGQGNVRMAEKLWHEMLRDGVEPSIEVVNCMLRVYNRVSGRSLDALAFAYDALDKYDLTLDAISIAQLVTRLLQDGNVDAAVELLEDAQGETSIEIGVLNAVLDASRQLESWDSVARIEAVIQQQQQHGEFENPVTQRLLELSRAKDASSSPGIAWTLSAPHPPISARAKQKEAEKRDAQRPARLQELLREIIAALEHVVDDDGAHDDGDMDTVLGQVTNAKQWERIFTAAPLKDTERFFALCQQLDQANAARDGEDVYKPFLDVTMYNLYLHALATQGHGDKHALLTRAVDILNEMLAKRQVDATSFNNVLALCSRMRELARAEIVLQKMKTAASTLRADWKPTVFSYNAVLNCCAGPKADMVRAERCVEELQAEGIAPDLVTLNTMLKLYSSASAKSSTRQREPMASSSVPGYQFSMRALRFFQKCTRKHRIEPDAATHFSLFRTFAQAADRFARVHGDDSGGDYDDEEEGSDDGVVEQLAAFVQRTCRHAPAAQLDVGVFNAAVDYFQRLGDVKTCFELFNIMTKSRGLEPNDLTLSLLFAACSREQQVDVGLKFLHYLMDDHEYHSSLNVLNGALRLCASSDAPQHALELFQGIQSSGVMQPDEATFVHVIHAFARQGDIAEARNFADAMLAQLGFASLDAYNRVLQSCAVARAPRQALSVLQHMEGSGDALAPNAVSYNMVLKAFAKGRTAVHHSEDDDSSDDEHVEDAEDGEEHDEEYDEDEDEDEEEPFSAGEIHQVMTELLEKMERRGLPLSAITYTRAIAACAVRGDARGVLRVFDAIMQRSDTCEAAMRLLSDSSMHNYLNACARVQDHERVAELLQFCTQWHEHTNKAVSRNVVLHLLQALDALGEWRSAVAVLRDLEAALGVRANVTFVNSVLETCNRAEQFQVTAQIFDTMQNAAAYRVFPNTKSYVEAIFAAEQREEWVHATNLFMEMQHKCPKDEIAAVGLQKIALGRYSEGRRTL